MQIPFYNSGFYYTPGPYHSMAISTSGHRLPCFQQKRKFYNICFRLADSQPEHILNNMERIIAKWRSEHPGETYPEIKRQREEFRQMEYWLHQGHGSCILQDSTIQRIITRVILSHDEIECQVGTFVIMGNHIHLVVKMQGENDMRDFLQKIKHESNDAIKAYLGIQSDDPIWMRGAFTRIIRSPRELTKTLRYIKNNPKGNPRFTVYERPDDRPFS